MPESGKLYYKTCRENAGLTQEEACVYLNIEEASTLSKYENGHLKVDQTMVKAMTLLYRNRLLPAWHLRHLNPDLAEFIPDPAELQSDSEFVLQCDFSVEELEKVYTEAKDFLRNDGILDREEIMELEKQIPTLQGLINKITGLINYVKNKSSKLEE